MCVRRERESAYVCVSESENSVLLVLLRIGFFTKWPCFKSFLSTEIPCHTVRHICCLLKRWPVASLPGTLDETLHTHTHSQKHTLNEGTSCQIIQINSVKSRVLPHSGDYYTWFILQSELVLLQTDSGFGLLMTAAPLIFQVISDAIFIHTCCLFMGPQLFVLARSETAGQPSPLFCYNSLFFLPHSRCSHGTAVGSD